MALNVKVGLFGSLGMLKFKNQAKTRENHIRKADNTPITSIFEINRKAELLHPEEQNLVITKIEELIPGIKSYILERADKKPVAYFRAGQYLSVKLKIDDSLVTRPYSISSSPSLALKGKYRITVESCKDGFVSNWINSNWKEGTLVMTSGPLGTFYYEGLRDEQQVIGLAGGSGITPFISLAHAIKDKDEDFNLTILYGVRLEKNILFRKELEKIEKECSKVKVIYVICDEKVDCMESGFIDHKLIKKYANDKPYSIYACGPQAMYSFLDKEFLKLKLDQKFIRKELYGTEKAPWNLPSYPQEAKDKVFKIKVKQCSEVKTIKAESNETVLVALERAGISSPSQCRSGECGFCRSHLISGKVFVPERNDGRRSADIEFGFIHPCNSFPISDLYIEIPASK